MKFLLIAALLALAVCMVYAESAVEEQPREVEEAKRDKRGLLAAPLTAYPYAPYAYASYAYSPYVAAPAVAAPYAARAIASPYAAYTYVV